MNAWGDESQNPVDSYQALIDRHSLLFYCLAYMRTGNKYDAEDIYQEVFLRCVSAKPKFLDEEHERVFLIRVTVNVSKSMLHMPASSVRVDLSRTRKKLRMRLLEEEALANV